MASPVRQCVILVGGLGTRLGPLTLDVPKPLLPVGGRPFLDLLVAEAARYGFTDIILLAGYLGAQVVDAFAGRRRIHGRDVTVRVLVERVPSGTGGALLSLAPFAEDAFVLMNGDSWFDIDLRAFAEGGLSSSTLVKVALHRQADVSRYGAVEVDGERVVSFGDRERGDLINAGIYLVNKGVLALIDRVPMSLESEVFPRLVRYGCLAASVNAGFFLDIGVPKDYVRAADLIATARRRPAIFFDRDGVLNEDAGHTHRVEDLRWMSGARHAIRRVNERGWYAFVVTNQAGVAHGLYTEAAVDAFHDRMDADLAEASAHVDEFVYCPFHPQAKVAAYRQDAWCRKPNPGMIEYLLAAWPIDKSASVLVGDTQADLLAAHAAGLNSVLHAGGNLADTIVPLLESRGCAS